MSEVLPAAIGLVASTLAVAGLAAAARAARRARTRRRQAEELQWARLRLHSAARSASIEITTWLPRLHGPLRDALVAVHTGLDATRDRLLDPPDHLSAGQGPPEVAPDLADLDALTATYAAVERLVAPVRDVVKRVAEIRDRLSDLDGADAAVPTGLRDRVAALLTAADGAAAHLAPEPPTTATALVEARERLERLARRSEQVHTEVYQRWSKRFPDRARHQGAELVDAWLDAVRREHGQAPLPTDRPRRPRPQPPQTDAPPPE